MIKITISYDVKITDEFIDDIITTAFEGGSNYWVDHVEIEHPEGAKPKGVPVSTWAADALNKGGSVLVFTKEEGDNNDFPPKSVTKEMLIKGIEMWAKEFPECVAVEDGEMNFENMDADDADIIFQYAIFDYVIFG